MYKIEKRVNYYLAGIIVLKLALTINLTISYNESSIDGVNFKINKFYASTSDSKAYYEPSKQLFWGNGKYSLNGKEYAGRMPGLAVLYVPLRVFINGNSALNAIIIIQILFSIFSIIAFYKLAQIIFKSRIWAILCTLSYVLFPYSYVWDIYILTESLALSLLIISSYFFFIWTKRPTKILYLMLSGTLLTWVVFLRYYILPVYLIFILSILFREKAIKSIFKYAFLFLLPLIIFDGLWTLRNYREFNRFIPLQEKQAGIHLSESTYAYRALIQAWGGNLSYWEKGAEATWFVPDEVLDRFKFDRPGDLILPSYIFDGTFTLDSLKKGRAHYIKSFVVNSNYQRHINDSLAVLTFSAFTNHIKSANPERFYLLNRLEYLRKYVLHIYAEKLTPEVSLHSSNMIKKLYKAAIIILNYLFTILGLLMAVYFLFKNLFAGDFINNKNIIGAIPLYIFLLLTVVVKSYEPRYMILAFPFLILSFYSGIILSFNYIKKRFSFSEDSKI